MKELSNAQLEKKEEKGDDRYLNIHFFVTLGNIALLGHSRTSMVCKHPLSIYHILTLLDMMSPVIKYTFTYYRVPSFVILFPCYHILQLRSYKYYMFMLEIFCPQKRQHSQLESEKNLPQQLQQKWISVLQINQFKLHIFVTTLAMFFFLLLTKISLFQLFSFFTLYISTNFNVCTKLVYHFCQLKIREKQG